MLSLGHQLEIVKDLGDAETVAADYRLDGFQGSHAIGHVRMATESDVDIAGAHPYWAYPFSDVAVVHNGQLTNYHYWSAGSSGPGTASSPSATRRSSPSTSPSGWPAATRSRTPCAASTELDGVFTYLCVTGDELGMAKDELAAKPLVLYESDDVVAMASEEIAIRKVIDREIETYDPYEGEVMVWHR